MEKDRSREVMDPAALSRAIGRLLAGATLAEAAARENLSYKRLKYYALQRYEERRIWVEKGDPAFHRRAARGSKREFIVAQPADMHPKDVVAKAKLEGLHFPPDYVRTVRIRAAQKREIKS